MSLRSALAGGVSLLAAVSLFAQPTSYPASAEVIDLTKPPYNADPTGVADAAPAINQAFLDHNSEYEILYLPAGTYRLAGPVEWGAPEGCDATQTFTCYRYTVLAGAGREATILRLDDDHPDFQADPSSSGRGVPVVKTDATAAMSFENGLRHLTVSTGSGNPAATAVWFQANNNGGIFDVAIRSEDGAGVIGLDLGGNGQNGPLLARDVSVEGFDVGVYAFANQNSLTLERLTLRGQRQYGLFNRQQVTTIRRLVSDNAVPAIYNQKDGGSTLTLVGAQLRNSSAPGTGSAIVNNNERPLYLRDVDLAGYDIAVANFTNGTNRGNVREEYIGEYFSGEVARACESPDRALALPIEETPEIVYADTATWADVEAFGAAIDRSGGQGSPADDTEAVVAALNSGASTIVFPSPREGFPAGFSMYGDIVIPPTVRHLIGARARIGGNWRFVVDDGAEPLVIEDFSTIGGIDHRGPRALQIERSRVRDYRARPGAGDVHLADVSGGPFAFRDQVVYARQLNTEQDTVNVTNDGGTLWILGLKTEKDQTVVRTINGGKTEILGALVYKQRGGPGLGPIFEVVDADLSVAGLKELNYNGEPYDVKVRESRGGVTRELTLAEGSALRTSLLAAFAPVGDPNAAPDVSAGDDLVVEGAPASVVLDGDIADDGLPNRSCFPAGAWSLIAGPAEPAFADLADPKSAVTLPEAGRYVLELAAADGAATSRDTVVVFVADASASTLDHDGDGEPSGRGADASLYRGGGRDVYNYGAGLGLAVRNNTIAGRKAIVRIDRAALPEVVDAALLELDIATTNVGLIESWTYNVFGLDDGQPGEDWIEGDLDDALAEGGEVTWANAPGNATTVNGGAYDPATDDGGGALASATTFLGTFTLRERRREKVTLSSDALRDFVNADTDGQLTFLITRVDRSSNVVAFAPKENDAFAPPRLYVAAAAPPASGDGAIGEVGTSVTDHNWRAVTFDRPYDDPVVVMGPLSFAGGQAATVRVRDVTSTGFEWRVEEWAYLDGAHLRERVGYAVVERGVYELPDGGLLEAGVSAVGDGAFGAYEFSAGFPEAPVVFAQVATVNEDQPVTVQLDAGTAAGFRMRLIEEENGGSRDGVRSHADETVAWIAVTPGIGSGEGADRYEVGATELLDFDTPWSDLTFAQSYPDPSRCWLGSIQTTRGGDPWTLRYRGDATDAFPASGLEFFGQEEASRDSELAHTKESVGYWILGAAGPLTGVPLAGAVQPRQGSRTSAWGGLRVVNPVAGGVLSLGFGDGALHGEPLRIELTSVAGQRVAHFEAAVGRTVEVALPNLPAGGYFLSVRGGGVVETRLVTVVD